MSKGRRGIATETKTLIAPAIIYCTDTTHLSTASYVLLVPNIVTYLQSLSTHHSLLEAPTATAPQSAAPYVGVIELHLGAIQSRASNQFAQFSYRLDLHQEITLMTIHDLHQQHNTCVNTGSAPTAKHVNAGPAPRTQHLYQYRTCTKSTTLVSIRDPGYEAPPHEGQGSVRRGQYKYSCES